MTIVDWREITNANARLNWPTALSHAANVAIVNDVAANDGHT